MNPKALFGTASKFKKAGKKVLLINAYGFNPEDYNIDIGDNLLVLTFMYAEKHTVKFKVFKTNYLLSMFTKEENNMLTSSIMVDYFPSLFDMGDNFEKAVNFELQASTCQYPFINNGKEYFYMVEP